MSQPDAPRTDGRMRVSLDPETGGPAPTLERVQMRRMAGNQLEALVHFAAAMPATTEVRLDFGQLQVHAKGQRRLALHIEDSGLWRSKWSHDHIQHAWLDQGLTLRVELRLPSRYEQVPQDAPFEARAFPEEPWTIMTRQQWLDALDRYG